MLESVVSHPFVTVVIVSAAFRFQDNLYIIGSFLHVISCRSPGKHGELVCIQVKYDVSLIWILWVRLSHVTVGGPTNYSNLILRMILNFVNNNIVAIEE